MAAKGKCGVGKNHAVHIKALGHPAYHEWETCKVGKEPARRQPIAARSTEMADYYMQERIPLVEYVIARDGGQCQIVSPWHERVADWNPLTVHEIRTRGREGGIMAEGVNDPANCVAACLRCNQAVSENADWAEAHGWLLPASEVVK